MHKSFISIVFSLAIFLCSLNSALAITNEKILIIGDSLSAGHGMKIQYSWPYLLQKKYLQSNKSAQIINASISGETTFGGNNRIQDLLQNYQPQIVIIELGGNDGLRGLNFKLSKKNIQSMIQTAQQKNIKVLLVGVRLPSNLGKLYNLKFQQMYESLAKENDIAYLPTFLKGIAENPKLMQNDRIHPTEKAQSILTDKVFNALEKI
ncbi:MAG: arylesterase [Gammaproteobacteria bacterium]|nr:arylesterase [Gammaproteobacteria bacterium]